jgi:secreted PhoX family phosphatase
LPGPGPYGPLLAPDPLGLLLPAGFTAREIARAGEVVASTGHVWHGYPDGGAVFRDRRGGWIYVSNAEQVAPNGRVGAVQFDRGGTIVDAYDICTGTARNCAGGASPWKTWLSCEEVAAGSVWECDPTGVRPAVARLALGTFQHEALAFDRRGRVYLTEDQPDGRLYRFTSDRRRDLSSGVLEVAAVAGDAVTWLPVPNPNPVVGVDTPTRQQVPASTAFNGGEGITSWRHLVYFTTKGDNRVWRYDTRSARLTIVYDVALDPGMQLSGVDNVTAARSGDIFVAEDGGNMELVMISRDGIATPLLRVVGQDTSELTGPAFDPSGRRLYVSSQRGGGIGITYEITGPFRRHAPTP